MEIKQVVHGGDDYEKLIELRKEVLRRPLGLDLTSEQIEAESDDIHLGVLEQDQALACLVLTPLNSSEIKMRQVAVSAAHQKTGLGTRVVAKSERIARDLGYRKIVLAARESAVPFYLRLGYKLVGDPFEEVGIPHRTMEKELSEPTAF